MKRSKDSLNTVLKERRLVLVKGEIQKEPTPDDELDPLATEAILRDLEPLERNPLEEVVQKFAALGYDAAGAFALLDDNGDEVLTLEEIRSGMAKENITLTPDEMKTFLDAIDANSDGVLTLEEWE